MCWHHSSHGKVPVPVQLFDQSTPIGREKLGNIMMVSFASCGILTFYFSDQCVFVHQVYVDDYIRREESTPCRQCGTCGRKMAKSISMDGYVLRDCLWIFEIVTYT